MCCICGGAIDNGVVAEFDAGEMSWGKKGSWHDEKVRWERGTYFRLWRWWRVSAMCRRREIDEAN